MCGLSAEPLIDLALADDQHECGVYTVFENFRSVLFKEIFQRNLFPVSFEINCFYFNVIFSFSS